MTNQDYTHLALILDRSGSMASIRSDMNGGVHALLQEQAKLPGKILVDVTTFDTRVETPYVDANPADIPEDLILPRGGTALLDAVGSTVVGLGERFAKLEEGERPSKVIVVIVTDGEENSSHEWNHAQISELVKEQEDKWSWEFIFLGANIDAFSAGVSFGLKGANTLGYAATAAGVTRGVAVASAYVTKSRLGYDTTLQDVDEEI